MGPEGQDCPLGHPEPISGTGVESFRLPENTHPPQEAEQQQQRCPRHPRGREKPFSKFLGPAQVGGVEQWVGDLFVVNKIEINKQITEECGRNMAGASWQVPREVL